MERITKMRLAFATGCKLLGLSQQTCLNLTLLLSSLEEIETMVWVLCEAEDKGIKLTRTQVVRIAEQIKEKSLAKQANSQKYQSASSDKSAGLNHSSTTDIDANIEFAP